MQHFTTNLSAVALQHLKPTLVTVGSSYVQILHFIDDVDDVQIDFNVE